MKKAFSEWFPLRRKPLSPVSSAWSDPVPGKEAP